MKKYVLPSILFLFVISNVFSQTEEPKYILASKLYTYKTLGFVVRFDKGIDSIYFPVDTKLVEVHKRLLDKTGNSEDASSQKIYYEYRFTAKVDTTYKLPSAQLWSNNESYEILLDKYVKLKKTDKPTEISQTDTIKKTRKKEDKIEPRISKNIKERAVLLWTDKNILQVNDHFKIVIESNMDFEKENISSKYIQRLSDKFDIIGSKIFVLFENGSEHHYRCFICKALVAGTIDIKPIDIKIENGKIKTNPWSFKIMD